MKISDFNEDSPYAILKRWASKTSQPRQYEKAAQTLHNVLVKKSRDNNLNHSLSYYAQQIGKSFAGIDYRALVDYYKEHYGTEGLAEFKIVKPDTKDTMGIKRNQMPQVATKDYPEFLDYLKDNGAHFTKDTVPADSLKAIQGEFSDQGVEKALRLSKIEKPIIASSDNYIIDGHHRWLAALNTGVDVNIFRVDIPGQELLQLVKAFPKTTYKDIYTEANEAFVEPQVNEAYILRLENDDDMLVLHIRDTKSGEHVEVRGKPNYEIDYDADDELHQLLDIIGKASNISELMNGKIVNINPKHPDGPMSYDAIEKVMGEGAEITMWTNPEYQGSDVDDEYYNKQPAKIIDISKLTPFEPADKMDDEISDANMN